MKLTSSILKEVNTEVAGELTNNISGLAGLGLYAIVDGKSRSYGNVIFP